MILCDLCGLETPCLQKDIDGREFDICEACWHPFAEKLNGKGRVKELFEEMEEFVESEI